MNQREITEAYNKIHEKGEFDFQEFAMEELPESTQRYLMMWVEHFGYTALVHTPPIEGTFVFKINHPVVQFLVHDSLACSGCGERSCGCNMSKGSHMWGNKNFDNLDNNLALALLVEKGADLGPERIQEIFDKFDREMGGKHAGPDEGS
jgi:hypothetical protein